MNKLTEEEKRKIWTHVYRNLDMPDVRPNTSSSTKTFESILSNNTKFSNHPSPGLDVSTLDLHHVINIDYPALEMLTDPSERGVLHKPFNVEQRYQPLPLIADNGVFVNARREKPAAAKFFSLYRSTSDEPSRRTMCGLLGQDVHEGTKYHGRTDLAVIILQTPQDLGLQVRVRRETFYYLKDGHEKREREDYNMTYDEFFSNTNEAQWYQDILHLITMRDDRSARYVQFKLLYLQEKEIPGAQDLVDGFCRSWKPRRQPDYGVYINNLVTDVKRPSSFLGTKACKICRKSFNRNSHTATALPCCSKLVAKPCLVEWCQSFNARTVTPPFSKPSCPSCEKPLFTDPRTIEHLDYGILADNYMPDKRYTEWENFERSCADLDRRYPTKSADVQITVNPVIFTLIWRKMIKQTTRHDEPIHLQPATFPELKLVEGELGYHFNALEGIATTVANLYTFFLEKIERAFKARFQQAGLDMYLPPGARGWVGNDQIKERMWRDGFSDFLLRILNRTLQFQAIRKCSCEQGKGRDFHWDGGREFWNPEKLAWLRTREFEGNVKWQRSQTGQKYLKEFLEGVRR